MSRRATELTLLTMYLICLGACSEGHDLGAKGQPEEDSSAGRQEGLPGSDEEGSPEATGCAARPGKLRGKSSQSVSVGETTRRFVYYVPEGLDVTAPVPLVIAVHGFAMSGDVMYSVTGFKELADREGFAAVFPEGASFSQPWNVGSGISGVSGGLSSGADDQAFLDAIQDFVDQDVCLDRAHVFVSGFSMGGYFSNESGCLRDDLAAIAPHSGGTHDLSACPGTIKPVILFHGEVDGVVPYASALEARDRWVARNGCSAEFDLESAEGEGHCEYYRDCPDHAQVAFCHFGGMEHKWAGGNDPSYWYGDPDRASAAELAWKFWQTYAW